MTDPPHSEKDRVDGLSDRSDGMAYFINSGFMLFKPGARPYFNFRIAEMTSSSVGSSTEVNWSVMVDSAWSSSVENGVPGW